MLPMRAGAGFGKIRVLGPRIVRRTDRTGGQIGPGSHAAHRLGEVFQRHRHRFAGVDFRALRRRDREGHILTILFVN